MAFSISENPIAKISSSYLQKCGILYFLPEDRSRVRFFFFFQGYRIDQVVLECCKRAHSNGNETV